MAASEPTALDIYLEHNYLRARYLLTLIRFVITNHLSRENGDHIQPLLTLVLFIMSAVVAES